MLKGKETIVGLLYRRYYQYSNRNTLTKLYLTLVRPHLEYACQVWDPHLVKDCGALESVHSECTQSRGSQTIVTFELPTLEVRRRIARLCTLYSLKNILIFLPGDLLIERHAVVRLDREQLL